ncbi:5'-methylthioadenosine/S-adenosylhomocysteine nucleosidase [Saccharothrix sp.]|uniref:5'-methylthioadenosine/S-adenosylhomocysteine nucleosidase family protein n=1 Tax=Saccharothrix sp. TaxID=1873460 RepID=UPI002811D60E|nr:5'-methylthioadenosine/S-adenosylhomocysteine nucleosidase [Saccharothrix sp.]
MLVILTALDIEGAAVRKHLTNLRPHHHGAGTVFEVGTLATRPSAEVALAVIGMGTVNAAAITERAIAEFRPSAVLFVGIAGGLREWIALGDVVVATRVYAYHGGRIDGDEFLARPQAWDTSHRLVQLAKHVNRAKAWPGAAETAAAVHFEPIAAGEVVLNSTTAPERDRLRSHYNDAVAVEMESSGVALAGHLHESTPTIAIRGISDHADGNKHQVDSGGWQDTAVRNAAAFAAGLAEAIDRTVDHTVGRAEKAANPPTPGVRTTSVTGGNAVGDITSTGPVTVDQKVTSHARHHPIRVVLLAIALIAALALIGWAASLY